MVDIRNHLNHQTNALNLLLTASQCRSLFEQVNLLRSDESRRVFKLVKDDTSSLLWLRDAESCYTQRSAFEETLDMIDSTFDFDRELFGSKAYLVASQSNMRHAIVSKPATATQKRSPSSSPSRDIINRLVANKDDNDVDAIRQGPASPQSPRVEHRASYEEHSQPSGKQEDNTSTHEAPTTSNSYRADRLSFEQGWSRQVSRHNTFAKHPPLHRQSSPASGENWKPSETDSKHQDCNSTG